MSFEHSATKVAVQQIGKNVSNPPPLVGTTTSGGVVKTGTFTLTRAGDIAETNAQREENGNLPPLRENNVLDAIATLRLEDMFKNQYFAHVSPASSSAVTVAKQVGYDYLAIGENLALGDFAGDVGVVDAWMHSPGHRANILNTHYTEIGVAVREGFFNGQDTWIAVQIFGRPASDCPLPDAKLQSDIVASEAQLSQLQLQLATEKSQIDAMQPQDQAGYDAYAQAITAYNALANQYNVLAAQAKTEVAQYNSQAEIYNKCTQ